jgi:hypothetical protein
MFEILEIVGKESTIARIDRALAAVSATAAPAPSGTPGTEEPGRYNGGE